MTTFTTCADRDIKAPIPLVLSEADTCLTMEITDLDSSKAQQKIGTLPLCCMMIGSVLGSGIIILPPLALESSGPWAIVGWLFTCLFGVAFAYLFATVGTLFPGEGGAASAVERAFGTEAKRLAAFTLSGAVLFGPAAVLLTVVEYLPPALLPTSSAGKAAVAAVLTVASSSLIISGLRNMSRFTMALATTATILLMAGASLTLFSNATVPSSLPPFDGSAFGYTMLLLFWAVVGWEVVGNYGGEVINPQRTVPLAAVIAAVIIGIVSMSVAAALQFGHFEGKTAQGVAVLLSPLFGTYSAWIMSGLTAALCITTYLVIVGAVSRLLAHLSKESGLPNWFDRRNASNVPWTVVVLYTAIHLLQFLLLALELVDLAGLVAIADGFFLANALLGTGAAFLLFPSPAPKAIALLLGLGILAVLLQSHWQTLLALALLALFCFRKQLLSIRAPR